MRLRYVASKISQTILPSSAIALLKKAERNLQQARLSSLPPFEERDLVAILTNRLGLEAGDTVFVHSSVDELQVSFPFGRILPLLRQIVGEKGTLVFPTYPLVSSSEFLRSGMVFNVRNTPSFTGMLTELARRHKNALRSLHPTKSVCAIGPNARELTMEHQRSPFPYDWCSPYFKLIQLKGKIIGLGVSSSRLSFVHCVDDALKRDFPVLPYHEQVFEAKCVNYDNQVEIVRSYAHDMSKMRHDVPRFVRAYIPREACEDLKIGKRKFFRVCAERLFAKMVELAKANITIYPTSVYSKRINVAAGQ